MDSLDRNQEIHFAEDGVSKLGIKINSVTQKVKELSGGNQQKVVVSKWLGQDMDLSSMTSPIKGIDIGSQRRYIPYHTGFFQPGHRGHLYLIRPGGGNQGI